MAEIIRMPRLSDTMEEGNIVAWMKSVGDKVKTGEVLAEVETDKATMELESFQDGTLLYIGVQSGPVAVDGIIAIIGKEGEDYSEQLKSAQGNVAPAAPVETVSTAVAEPVKQTTAMPSPSAVATNIPSSNGGRVLASPLAKSLAQEIGIDIANVSGSGEGGRIIKKDIESFKAGNQNGGTPAVTTTVQSIRPEASNISFGDHPVSQMRKVIAKRLGESKFSAPHFYLTVEINMDNAIAARKEINENSGSKISFNDFVVKACAMSLRHHPYVNSSWMGDKITVHSHINIGVAVAVEDGLLVPVINNADAKTMSHINSEVRTLADKAKNKKLQPQEMTGNTFTISNLGMFDIEEFTAIINPPDACILAVGSIIEKPIVRNGAIVIGNMMKVTLSCDHRVVDGAKGAEFLKTLKGMLENPVRMLV